MDLWMLGAVWYVVFLFSTTLHEAAHAWAAARGGDFTAHAGGQVTLDPVPHIRREIIGTVVVPIVSFWANHGNWMIGWASTPYNAAWAEQYPRRAAWMSLAGPAANLSLVVFAGVLIRLGIAGGFFAVPDQIRFTHVVDAARAGWGDGAAVLVSILFTLNLVLFAFNLLPVPPLDGASGITLLMGEDLARRWRAIVQQPVFFYVGLLIAWRFFGFFFGPVHSLALKILYPGVAYQ